MKIDSVTILLTDAVLYNFVFVGLKLNITLISRSFNNLFDPCGTQSKVVLHLLKMPQS